MEKRFMYNIEIISFKKEKKNVELLVEGWVFSYNSGVSVCIKKNESDLIIEKCAIERNDVVEQFKLDDSKKMCGFKIIVNNFSSKSKYYLHISDSEQSENIEIIYSDKYKEFNRNIENRRIFTIRNLKKFMLSLRNDGIRLTYSKLKLLKENNKELVDNSEYIEKIYAFNESSIPDGWMKIQKYKPVVGILIPIKNIEIRFSVISECIASILNQQYSKINIYPIVVTDEMEAYNKYLRDILDKNPLVLSNPNAGIKDYINYGFLNIKENYFTVIEQEDLLVKSALSHAIEELNFNNKLKVIYSDYDNFEKDNEYYNPIIKNKLNILNNELENFTQGFTLFYKEPMEEHGSYENYIMNIKNIISEEELCYINNVLLHKRIIENVWNNKKVKAIAFYLPQFHAIEINDKYWGKGFTEWVNVKRAKSFFKDHYQQRIPSELGYYNLVDDKDIQLKQIELAKQYDIYGFCYYYYWFNGKRVLEKPLNQVLNNRELDMPFCICWANENWTKRWDGMEKEVIIEQKHEIDSDNRFIKDIIDILNDCRYIRIDNAPLLIIYKIHLLKDPINSIRVWREVAREHGIPNIYIALVNHPGMQDLKYYGGDSLIEFPPHNINFNNITHDVEELSKDFVGGVYDYKNYVDRIEELGFYKEKIFRGCMLQWDNTARRMEQASIFHNFSLEEYEKWLYKSSEYCKNMNKENENFIFINAWNEWAEGTYLEPDEKYGRGYLEATKKIINSR